MDYNADCTPWQEPLEEMFHVDRSSTRRNSHASQSDYAASCRSSSPPSIARAGSTIDSLQSLIEFNIAAACTASAWPWAARCSSSTRRSGPGHPHCRHHAVKRPRAGGDQYRRRGHRPRGALQPGGRGRRRRRADGHPAASSCRSGAEEIVRLLPRNFARRFASRFSCRTCRRRRSRRGWRCASPGGMRARPLHQGRDAAGDQQGCGHGRRCRRMR